MEMKIGKFGARGASFVLPLQPLLRVFFLFLRLVRTKRIVYRKLVCLAESQHMLSHKADFFETATSVWSHSPFLDLSVFSVADCC